MSDKRFLDTNVLVYAHTDLDLRKQQLAQQIIIREETIVSTQGFSFYDSLIIAAALESDCKCLISEDLHHGQSVDKILVIENPFG